LFGAPCGRRWVGVLHGEGGHRGLSRGVFRAGGGVHQYADVVLLPQLDGLGPVLPGVGETERGQRAGDLGGGGVIDAQFHERVAPQWGRGRQFGLARAGAGALGTVAGN
jgi:hypothetical protein